MRSLADVELALVAAKTGEPDTVAYATRLLAIGESILEIWIAAHGGEPTPSKREGFRVLALHRQGAAGEPSFNACRETCRELVYYYNLLTLEPRHEDVEKRRRMMHFVAQHLFLFISGKMQEAALGDFCCSSKPLRRAG